MKGYQERRSSCEAHTVSKGMKNRLMELQKLLDRIFFYMCTWTATEKATLSGENTSTAGNPLQSKLGKRRKEETTPVLGDGQKAILSGWSQVCIQTFTANFANLLGSWGSFPLREFSRVRTYCRESFRSVC